MTSIAATPDSSLSAPVAVAAPKLDLTDLADPTKVASQSLSFHDVLAAINPLQHIPVVGTIYRAITGDAPPPPAARVIGGLLLGGPVGLVTSVANAILEQTSGKDLGDHALAMLGIGHDLHSDAPQYAGSPAPPAPMTDTTAGGDNPPATPSAVPAAVATAASVPVTAGDSSVAPLSRAVQGNAPAPLPPLAAMGGRPGLLGSSTKPAGSGFTLADYKAFAGHGMPVNTANSAPPRNAPVPFQTTVPLSNDVAHMAITPPVATPAAAVAPPAAETPPNPADSWISQAMMRGLDRYRDMKKLQDQTQRSNSQVDGTF